MSTAVVITTIQPPTPAVEEYAAWDARVNGPTSCRLYLIGDEGGPRQVEYDRRGYVGFEHQHRFEFTYAKWAPTHHYARKNLGYLLAIAQGARVILDTDDDNTPLGNFFGGWAPEQVAPWTHNVGWTNVYPYFMQNTCWPRGLPLGSLSGSLDVEPAIDEPVFCPVQQSLVAGDPDVDAVYRFIFPWNPDYHPGERSLILGARSVCPFNSQATRWFYEAFPLLYLPATCTMRCSDIWRSLVAQRCMHERGWHVLFTSPQVHQDRNPHDLQRDLEDELPLYRWNTHIWEALDALKLTGDLQVDMRLCYGAIIQLGALEPPEVAGLVRWLDDVTKLGRWTA